MRVPGPLRRVDAHAGSSAPKRETVKKVVAAPLHQAEENGAHILLEDIRGYRIETRTDFAGAHAYGLAVDPLCGACASCAGSALDFDGTIAYRTLWGSMYRPERGAATFLNETGTRGDASRKAGL